MVESLAVPDDGGNPISQKDLCLDPIRMLLPNMTQEQMERGRQLGALRSKRARLLRQVEKGLAELNRTTERLNRLLSQCSLSTGSTAPVVPVPLGVFELRVLDISLDLSLSRRRVREDKPSLSGCLSCAPARVEPVPRTRTRTAVRSGVPEYDAHPGFLRFWSVWPKKVGKLGAYAEWVKLNPDQALEDRIIAAVRAQLENTWHDQDAKYILDPERWLKRGRWEDEIIKPKLTREQELDQEYQRVCKEIADAKSG